MKPLIMPGKKTLPQRVLVRQGGPGLDAPDGKTLRQVFPLQQLFVYARKDSWVEVGLGQQGKDLFWLPEKSVVDWKQNIVLTLTAAPGMGRLLFFKTMDDAEGVIESEDPGKDAAALRRKAEKAEAGGAKSEEVVALGPKQAIDQTRHLHVLPILSTQSSMFDSGAYVNLLRVAVARAQNHQPGAGPVTGSVPAPDKKFRAAVVFVVDTTQSMGPYIASTRDAMRSVYDEIAKAGLSDSVSFGLVGFRDNTKVAPGLGYVAKRFVSLEQGKTEQGFLAGIDKMHESTTPSRNFREDSYAGIDKALGAQMDWKGYSARFIVLVTDASPRELGDKLSDTSLSAQSLNTMVREQLHGVIAVLHLLTPAGAKNGDHARAKDAYTRLTTFPNLGQPLYFPVKDGSRANYVAAAKQLARAIVAAIGQSRPGGSVPRIAQIGDSHIASAVGAAMQSMKLQYLGSVDGTQAPDVFNAVVADRDFADPRLKPVQIRILITKTQLSDLSESLKIIIDKAEANVLDPNKFFNQVLAAAADMSRRPTSVARADQSLADAVSISEMLDGLPYKSRIMNITQDDWVRMSISEQQSIINDLHDKLERYRRYNAQTDQWVNYMGGQGADSLLYPMLLDDLP